MNIEVINTGTELLLGNVVNTHLAYFGRQLFTLGLRIQRQTTVPDGSAIRHALAEASDRADIVLVTGGLGPTTDDITREIVAEMLGLKLEENTEVLAAIGNRLARRNIIFRERMKRQAMVPEGATVLPNENGTAPGLYLPARSTPSSAMPHLFLFPGPPRELKPMFENHAMPVLRALAKESGGPDCRIYRVVGMGESAVEEVIGLSLTERGDVEVGYCARPNEVDLRLIGPKAVLDEIEPHVTAALGEFLIARGEESFEEVVVAQLRAQHRTVAVAESCTGGLLSHRLTNVPGASEIFPEGFITYANEAKVRSLGVPEALLASHGAVSEPVARAMAEGAITRAGADFGIGITGIAGPTGGTPEKPMGTVFIALAEKGGLTECAKEAFPSDRETFKQLATQKALSMLHRRIFS